VQQSGQWVTPVDRESGHPAYTPTVTPLVPVDLTFLRLPL